MTDDKTYQPLALNVPEPGCRPGDTPDFSYFEVPRAGAVARPAVDVDPDDMREMAFSIVRVLNKEGEAVGDWAGALTPEELREGLRDMMLLRAFDARMQNAQRQGKTSFYMQHLGEEAVSCAFSRALQDGDMNFPTYRQAGLLIARDYPLVTMMKPDLFQRGRPFARSPVADHVFVKGAWVLFDFWQPWHPICAGRGLGDGLCHFR